MVRRRATLGSRAVMSAVDGRTIGPKTRISPPAEGSARCSVSRARAQRKGFAAVYNTFNVQRHLTTRPTHWAFRAATMNAWREAAARLHKVAQGDDLLLP